VSQETTTHQVEGEADDFRHWVGTVGGGNAAGDGSGFLVEKLEFQGAFF